MLARVLLFLVLFVQLTGMQADAADKAGKPVVALAHEIEGKIILKDRQPVRVQADSCRIEIAFVNQNVTFHLPLAGTKVTRDDEMLLVVNGNMTRTVSSRPHEPFTQLMLRFDSFTVDQVRSAFEQAIRSCGS